MSASGHKLTPETLPEMALRAIAGSCRTDLAKYRDSVLPSRRPIGIPQARVALRRLRAKPQEFLELNSIETIVELVRDGMGVAMLPNLARHGWEGDPRLRVLPLAQTAESRQIALVQLRTAARAEIITAVGQQFVAALAVPD